MTGLLSALGFITSFASSIIAPALLFIQKEFEISGLALTSLTVSIFLLGYAVGPLFLSPLSEIHGRYAVMTASSAFFCLCTVGCALAPSLESLIVFRFLCGVGGSASQTVGGAVVADLFSSQERGRALGVWMLGPILGPSCAPLIGAFVAEKIGWRWASWITLIPSVVVVGAMALCNKETNHQVLIERKAMRIRKELGRPELRSCYTDAGALPSSTAKVLRQGLFRPIKMLFSSVIIFGVSLYIAFAYGCLYLLFNTIPMVFQESYGWSLSVTGIVYLALLIGYLIGLVVFYTMSDRIASLMTRANGGAYEPEMRLPVSVYLSIMLPVSFFWYGWSSARDSHWIVPIIGLVVFGIGFESVWLPTQAYVVDAYSQYSASALAACSVMRSVVAAFLPLAGPQIYDALGVGWGSSVLGFIALALVPVPLLAYKYGKSIRRHEGLKV
jgi:multidrug resistance protein